MAKKGGKSSEKSEDSGEGGSSQDQLVQMMKLMVQRLDKLEEANKKNAADLREEVSEKLTKATRELERSFDSSKSDGGERRKKRSQEFTTWMGFASGMLDTMDRMSPSDLGPVADLVKRWKLEFEVVKRLGFGNELLDEPNNSKVRDALEQSMIIRSAVGGSQRSYSTSDRGRGRFRPNACYICGNESHWASECYAVEDVYGNVIPESKRGKGKKPSGSGGGKKKSGRERSRSREKN